MIIESQNGLGCKGPQCPSSSNPLLCEGHQPAAQAAQSHIQPGLECLRDGASTASLGITKVTYQLLISYQQPLRESRPEFI